MRGMKKPKKRQNSNKKRKEDHEMQTTKPLSPVFVKEKNRQHSHKTMQIKRLKHTHNTRKNTHTYTQ